MLNKMDRMLRNVGDIEGAIAVWRREVGEEVKGNSRIPLVKYLVRQWDGKVNGAFRYLYMNLYISKKKKMNQIFVRIKIHFYQMCSKKCNK